MRTVFFAVVALLSLGGAVHAIIPEGQPPFIVGPQREPVSLAQTLKKATPSETQVTIAVGDEIAYLPQDAPLPDPEAKIPSIVAAFGFLAHDFHDVTAVAPATMTVLNTNPGKPDPYDGMPPEDAFKLLLGGLNADQWALLTGKTGLGVSDLTTDQRQLYQALFPDKVLSFIPRKGGFDQIAMVEPPPMLEMGELMSARLRLARRVEVGIPLTTDPSLSIPASAPPSIPEFQALGGGSASGLRETVYGATLRATVPNVPKKSDLDTDGDEFAANIDLTSVQKVGDLVTRIGVATRTELYADARYEKQSLLLLGPKSAPAKDLLRALAFCLRGTFRKVGPAYVLTNDVVGSGTRRAILTRFAQQAAIDRTAAVSAASDRAFQMHAGIEDTSIGDALTMTDAQQTIARADPGYTPGDVFSLTAPLDTLTPEQQRLVQTLVRDWNADHKATESFPDAGPQMTTRGAIRLSSVPTLFLDTAAVHGPVVLDDYLGVRGAMRPAPKRQEDLAQNSSAQDSAKPGDAASGKPGAPEPPSAKDVKAAFAHLAHRAIIAHPRTSEEVDQLIARMKAIGLNELWLDVFSAGQSYLQDTPDILTEALAQAKGAKISVIPAITPLDWGGNAPKELQDRTIIDENSAQAGAWGQRYENIVDLSDEPELGGPQDLPSEVFVSPTQPAVVNTLTEQIRKVSQTPGVGVMTLLAQEEPGYESAQSAHDRSLGYTLGYTEPLRLGFLRARHVDPVDIDPEIDGGPPVSLLYIPEFRDYEIQGAGQQEWDDFRASAFTDLMKKLLAAAQTGMGQPAGFLVPARGSYTNYDWYGLWEDPQTPMPYTELTEWTGDAQPQIAVNARKQSRRNVKLLDGDVTDSPTDLLDAIKTVAPAWDGFVIDLTDGSANDATLAALAKSLKQIR